MVLTVVTYGNPVLRKKGVRVEKITPEVSQLIRDMLETMKTEEGVGLAAQQVGHALQLAVIDVSEATERPSTMKINGESVDVTKFMPMALINPEITPLSDPVEGPEGCLSFPEIYADVSRPESVRVKALNAKGESMEFECGGLLARAVQHEYDHLQGILFIDRMKKVDKLDLKPQLDDLQAATKQALVTR